MTTGHLKAAVRGSQEHQEEGTMTNTAHPNESGIPTDFIPVIPADDIDNVGSECIGLYVTTAGKIRLKTFTGDIRTIPIAAQTPLLILCYRVFNTGTTAKGIFAMRG